MAFSALARNLFEEAIQVDFSQLNITFLDPLGAPWNRKPAQANLQVAELLTPRNLEAFSLNSHKRTSLDPRPRNPKPH